MPKNIVICCDGTGNQFGDANSNVVRLYTSIDVKEEQIAYYHPGVGTMGAPNETTALGRAWSQVAGLAFGAGFEANVMDAYKYLMENYADGDRIYLFGFSRGAYTVRALAGMLYVYGLLCPGNEGHLDYVMRMYAQASKDAYGARKHRLPKNLVAEAFKETFSREVAIHFMGVWDTVSSVGWVTDPVKLLYDGQNPIVETIRHAVSVDERRCFFQDNLLGEALSPDETPLLQGKQQNVVQAWFAGVHSDVGGSYVQAECAPAPDAFQWIFKEACSAGLISHPEKFNAVMGHPGTKFTGIAALSHPPKPMKCLHDSLTLAWWPLELFPHKFYDGDGDRHWNFSPMAHRRKVPDGALLHPSLLARLKADPQYQPPNLIRKLILPLSESPVPMPLATVVKDLEDEEYGVYRPGQPVPKPAITPIRAAAAAVIVLVGVAWSLTRR